MKKILIVDDEPNNRLLLQEILEDLEEDGARLLYAANGAEALNLIQSEKPDLVFLDIMLPDVDGLEICRIVKNQLDPEKPFIAVLTAKSQNADKRQALEAKADLYIIKPFRTSVILNVVRQVFGTR